MAKIGLKVEGIERITANFNNLERLLKSSRALLETAQDVRNIVVKRTLKGLDVDLNPFKPYSNTPLYVPLTHRPTPRGGRRLSKSGKPMKTVFYEGGYAEFSRAVKGEGKPNLFATGDMFRAFQVQKRQIRGTRAFILFTRRFPAIKAAANNARRTFVGLNKAKELPIVQQIFTRKVNAAIKKAKLA